MTIVKTLAVTAALIVGASSFAIAQNGPPTGGNTPAAGGAGNSSAGTSSKSMSQHGMPAHKMTKHKKKEAPPS